MVGSSLASTSWALRPVIIFLALTLALLLAVAPTAGQGIPEITLGTAAVTVAGVTPGGSVAWVSLTRQRAGYYPVTRYGAEILVDDDGDGGLTIDYPDGVPPMALFLAVDLATGEGSWITPQGFEPRALELPAQALAQGPAGGLSRLAQPGSLWHAVWVRSGPEAGVWQLLADDGGEADDDGAPDGSVRFALEQLTPVGGSAATPHQVIAGDLLVVMEPRTFELAVLAVSAAPNGGGL